MKLNIEYEVKPQDLCDLVVTAFEGGVNYWCWGADQVEGEKAPDDSLVWYGQKEVYTPALKFKIRYDDPEKDAYNEGGASGEKIVTYDDLKKGLECMARDWPYHFNNFVTDNYDAITGDVFLQCVLFEDIIYG